MTLLSDLWSDWTGRLFLGIFAACFAAIALLIVAVCLGWIKDDPNCDTYVMPVGKTIIVTQTCHDPAPVSK